LGVSLCYATTQPVTNEVREFLERAANEVKRGRDWWAEPIHFFDDWDRPDCVVGNSKLFRPGFDCDDDSFLAWRDAQFIIAALAKWASNFGLTWRLSFDAYQAENPEIGTIGARGADDRVSAFLSNLAALTCHPTSDQRTVETIAEGLLQKYSERDA